MASSTSGLVEVETTAAGASRTEGITSEEVLPERGGPKMSMEPSGPAKEKHTPSASEESPR